MNRTCTLTAALMLVATLALVFSASAKPAPDRHPAYLHALGNLRHARAYLAHPDSGEMKDPERNAIAEIDEAIAEIRSAADDGKNLEDHPGLDSHLRWIGRLNKAADLLNKAHDDVAKEEDDASAQGCRRGFWGTLAKLTSTWKKRFRLSNKGTAADT